MVEQKESPETAVSGDVVTWSKVGARLRCLLAMIHGCGVVVEPVVGVERVGVAGLRTYRDAIGPFKIVGNIEAVAGAALITRFQGASHRSPYALGVHRPHGDVKGLVGGEVFGKYRYLSIFGDFANGKGRNTVINRIAGCGWCGCRTGSCGGG